MTTTNTAEPRIILPDTSLCAIVRDEIMNPAGGIVDFVDSTLPYVEAGVIVDTGSKDGTREALEELTKKYKHLKVYDIPFQGFAHARNHSLKHCKTKRALVLDADERLTKEDFKEINVELSYSKDRQGYNLCFTNIRANEEDLYAGGWNPRLFEVKLANFVGTVWENIHFGGRLNYNSYVRIKHFRPSQELYLRKANEFYEQWNKLVEDIQTIKPLRDFPFFQDLKKYNPKREEYR